MQNNPSFLWLPSWYPNKLAPYDGDFIRRHAQAVSVFNEVMLIYVIRDINGIVTRDVSVEVYKKDKLTEKIIYYYSEKKKLILLDKLFSEIKYRRLYKRTVKEYIGQKGKPAIVHVHVALKAGIIAGWIRNRFHIPYIITEHSTIFLPEEKNKFVDFPLYFRLAWKKIMKQASGISVVSHYLGEQIKKHLSIEYIVIPNVVDTTIFKPIDHPVSGKMRFIHISSLNCQKNPEAIFHAFALVKNQYQNLYLDIFGPASPHLEQLVTELELQLFVNFHPEIPQNELVQYVQQSRALILYSRYETFGCVIIEANACGIPCIVSNIPVMHEIVEDCVNGIFVPGENPRDLANKIKWFIDNYHGFNKVNIAEGSLSKYSYEVVAKQFLQWYASVLKNG